jgi:hypothetical protein
MMFLDTCLEPIRDPDAAVEAWQRIYADRDEPADTDDGCKRLALGMLVSAEVRRAVEERAVGQRPAVPGFITELARLAERVRIGSLQLLLETDPAAAAFVARHPQAIPLLLQEEGEEDAGPEPRLTPTVRQDPRRFLRRMKLVAPLMLERVGIGKQHAEQFLRDLHRGEIIERLQRAPSARVELCAVLADFCHTHCPEKEAEVRLSLNRAVMDNILWQTATVLCRAACRDEEDRGRLRHVENALRERIHARRRPLLGEWALHATFSLFVSRGLEPARHTVTHALLDSLAGDESRTARWLEQIATFLPVAEEDDGH